MSKRLLLFMITALLLNVLLHPHSAAMASVDYIRSNSIKENLYNILIELTERKLYLIDTVENKIVRAFPIASGKKETPTPTGTWKIVSKAAWDGGFGARWMELNIPWGAYGIHGTNRPGSIGLAASHGCIRMFNPHVKQLYDLVDIGTTVTIYGGPYGLNDSSFRTLIHGDKGSDVCEVQRKLKEKGYYPEDVDGVFGDALRTSVLKFRKFNSLEKSDIVDKCFYDKLGIYPFE